MSDEINNTVADLIKILKELPQDYVIYLECEGAAAEWSGDISSHDIGHYAKTIMLEERHYSCDCNKCCRQEQKE